MVSVCTNTASSFFLQRAWHPQSSTFRISHMDTIDKTVRPTLTCNHTWQICKGLPSNTQISPLVQIPAGDMCACKQLYICIPSKFKCFCKKLSNFLVGVPSFTSLAASLNKLGSWSFSMSWHKISAVTDFSKAFKLWMEDAYPEHQGQRGLHKANQHASKRPHNKISNKPATYPQPSVSW